MQPRRTEESTIEEGYPAPLRPAGRAVGAVVEPMEYRRVLGHFPTGVTVITASGHSNPVGLSVNSFTSVSLDPPLVCFFPAQRSRAWSAIRHSGRFCVNVLAADQAPVARLFATPGADRFRNLDWAPAPHSGAPLLGGVVAWIDCAIEAVAPTGDHDMALGRVLGLGTDPTREPLVFHRGRYGTAN